MTEEFECEDCGRTFDSKRGLSSHQRQAHPEDGSGNSDGSSESQTIELTVNHALIGVFVLGLAVGFSSGIMVGGGPTLVGDVGTMPTGENSNSGAPSGVVELQQTEFPYEADYGVGSGSVTYGNQTFELEGEPYIGSPDAELKLASFEDFQCPFCQQYNQNAFQDILSNYIETGDVQYFFKQYPIPELGHNWAEPAAVASECALNQDEATFWVFKKGFFDNQDRLTQASRSGNFDASMYRWAEQTGLDTDQFKQCYDNQETIDEVRQDRSEPGSLGTPTIFVGGEKIEGAQPFGVFESAIESHLN